MIDELRELHASQRDAHLNADAAGMVALLADDFVSVQDGAVTRPSREASRARFERYFAQVTFLAWADVVEPVIELAGDGSLATILVQKRVHLTYRDASGAQAEEETLFAWVETWRRRHGHWELAMVVSTRREAPA